MPEEIVCQRCGSIDDYRTVPAGPHIKAICNGCDRYIKFIKQEQPVIDKSAVGRIIANTNIMIIKVKLDVSKIDKTKLFKGEKGIYLDATILLKEDQPADSYGNHGMIVQDVSKEEREAGNKGPILGNVKIMGGAKAPEVVKPATPEDLNGLPF